MIRLYPLGRLTAVNPCVFWTSAIANNRSAHHRVPSPVPTAVERQSAGTRLQARRVSAPGALAGQREGAGQLLPAWEGQLARPHWRCRGRRSFNPTAEGRLSRLGAARGRWQRGGCR